MLKVGSAIERTIGAGARVAPSGDMPGTNSTPSMPLHASDQAAVQIAEQALRTEGLPVRERYVGILASVLPYVEEMRNTIRVATRAVGSP